MSLSMLERLAPVLRRPPALPRRAPPHCAFVREDRVFVHAPDGEPLSDHAPAEDWLAPLAGRNLVLLLSGRVTHQLLVSDPALPMHDHETLLAWARHQFVHYHGTPAEHWPVAAWQAGEQRGASAVHGVDLTALGLRCTELGVRLRAAHPWWALGLRATMRADPALAAGNAGASLWLVEGEHVTRLVCRARRLESIDQHWLAAADGRALAALYAERGDPSVPTVVMGYGLTDAAGLPDTLRTRGTLTASRPATEALRA